MTTTNLDTLIEQLPKEVLSKVKVGEGVLVIPKRISSNELREVLGEEVRVTHTDTNALFKSTNCKRPKNRNLTQLLMDLSK